MLLAHCTVGLFPSFQEEMYDRVIIFSPSVYLRIFRFQLSKEMIFFFRNLSLTQIEGTTTSIKGALAKLREAIFNFVMSVCPSALTFVSMERVFIESDT